MPFTMGVQEDWLMKERWGFSVNRAMRPGGIKMSEKNRNVMWGENGLPQGRKMEQKPKYDRVVSQESVRNPLRQSDGDHSLLLPNLGAECWSYETVTITVFKLTINKLNFVHNSVLPGRNQILLTGLVFLGATLLDRYVFTTPTCSGEACLLL